MKLLSVRKLLLICIGIFLISEVLLLLHIQYPEKHSFDEFHYMPSAKQWLALRENQNWEHPPLAKQLMGLGLYLFGDEPLGWRFFSTVFGSLTMVAMFLWGLTLFQSLGAAVLVTAITAFNQITYVQSRIGMLDPFMIGFQTWALAAFTVLWMEDLPLRVARRWLWALGSTLGLAVACKWFAVIPWFTLIGLLTLAYVHAWLWPSSAAVGKNRKKGAPEIISWLPSTRFSGLRIPDWILGLGVLPLVFYYLTFIPYFFIDKTPPYSLADFFWGLHATMYDGQLRVITDHPYHSDWKTWPLMLRPIWYTFDKVGSSEGVRGVICLGNPLIMWGGLLTLGACAWSWWKDRSKQAFLIVSLWVAFYGCWAVIPRKISFYYYYYPAALVFSLSWTYVFERYERGTQLLRYAFIGVCAGIFFYFLPVLGAWEIGAEEFRKWTWFKSWI